MTSHTQSDKKPSRRRSFVLLAAGTGIALLASVIPKLIPRRRHPAGRGMTVTTHPDAVQRTKRNVNA